MTPFHFNHQFYSIANISLSLKMRILLLLLVCFVWLLLAQDCIDICEIEGIYNSSVEVVFASVALTIHGNRMFNWPYFLFLRHTLI